jgi:hypothetical protein
MGGESQRASLNRFRAILYARFIGNPSYLPSIRVLIAVHCRNYRGESIAIENDRGLPVLAQKKPNGMQKTAHDAPQKTMQFSIYRGGIDVFSRVSPARLLAVALFNHRHSLFQVCRSVYVKKREKF